MPCDSAHPVLILDGPGRIVVAIARSLHRRGIPVDAAHFRSTASPGFCSRAIRSVLSVADYTGDGDRLLSELAGLAAARGYDMVIPASDAALAALGSCYRRLSQLVHVATPPPHIVTRVLEKPDTLRAASECGIPIPRSWDIRETPVFPLVSKPASKAEAPKFRVRHVRTPAELDELRRLIAGCEDQYLLQEYCEGEGVGIETLIWDGEPVALFQHRRLTENPATGGVSVVAESEPLDPALAEMAVRLLRRLAWSGPAMVEFRRDRASGRVALMEVNGRYWGSLALPCLAGIEFPYYHWQLVHGRRPTAVPARYPAGLRVRWTTGEFLRLKGLAGDWAAGRIGLGKLGRETAQFCSRLVNGAYDAMSVRGDRRPGFAELWFIATRRLARFRPRKAAGRDAQGVTRPPPRGVH